MKAIRRIVMVALVCILLLTTGCGNSQTPPETIPEETTLSTGETPAVQTEVAEITEPTGSIGMPEESFTSLISLRQAMVETPQLFAVAYFGYHETIDSDLPVDPFEVMQEYAYGLCQDLPFLLDIPRDRIIGETGDLFCIVPLDENATVAVSKGYWDEENQQYIYDDILYSSNTGDPILLLCNNAGWEPDTQVYISGPSGEVFWYPQADDNLCAAPLRNDNWDDLFMDFSPYREILMKRHRDMKDSEWVMPTAEMLAGTTWVWDGYLKDGREVCYRVTFGENTLTVNWDDGLDALYYEYTDAPWELTYDEGFAILSIDFQEMAGVLHYNLLYHEDYEQLYVAIDAVREEMPFGWEPLYRFLRPSTAPEPSEMLGVWELAWTEVEGDRNEADPGTEYITIFLNDQDVFRITLDDRINPQDSFVNKELAVYDEEMFDGCGNDQWLAYVGYMGPWDTIYSVTLLEDDMLLLRMYWEVDGMPMVAHKWYRRLNG